MFRLRQPRMLCCHCLPPGSLHVHRAISHWKWYETVCMRYLASVFSKMKSINMFTMFLQSGVPRHFLWRFIVVWIYNLTIFMFMYVNVDLKLQRQYAETWVFGMFSCCARQGNYILGLGNYRFLHGCSGNMWTIVLTFLQDLQLTLTEPLFRKRHFQIRFLELKLLYLNSNFTEICFEGYN